MGEDDGQDEQTRLFFNMRNDSHELLRRVRHELQLQADFDSSVRPKELTYTVQPQASLLLCTKGFDEQGSDDAHKAAEF